MPKHPIYGVWRLTRITLPSLQGAKFNCTLHFTDGKYLFEDNGQEITRHRYRLHDDANPAEIEIGGRRRVYRIEGTTLFISEAPHQQPDSGAVSIYEYIGDGPSDWETSYRRRIRQQLAGAAERFATAGPDKDEQGEHEMGRSTLNRQPPGPSGEGRSDA